MVVRTTKKKAFPSLILLNPAWSLMNGKSVRPANGALISPLRKHSSHLFIASFPDQLSVLFGVDYPDGLKYLVKSLRNKKLKLNEWTFIPRSMKIVECWKMFTINWLLILRQHFNENKWSFSHLYNSKRTWFMIEIKRWFTLSIHSIVLR